MDKQEIKKTDPLMIVLIAVIVSAVVLGIVAAIAWSRGQSLPELIRAAAGLGEKDAGELYYDTAGSAAFGRIDNGFITASSTGVQVYTPEGEKRIDEYLPLYAPVITAAGKYAAAYDTGGKDVLFFTRDKVILHIAAEEPVISACVNEKGYLTVTSEETGYKGAVTVYDKSGTPVYRWHSGSAYPIKGVMNDRRELAVQTVGEGGSSVVFFTTDSEEEKGRYSCGGIIIDIEWTDGVLTVLTEDEVVFLDRTGQEKAVWDHTGRYIKGFAVGEDYIAVATTDFLMDTAGILDIIGADGQVRSSTGVAGDILSMDAEGDCIAVLYSGSALITDSRLSRLSTFEDVTASAIVARPGGGAFAAAAYSARMLTPEKDEGRNAEEK